MLDLLHQLRFRRVLSDQKQIRVQLEQIIAMLEDPERLQRVVPGCSAWSVHQHLEHLALATDVMITRIEQALGPEGKPGNTGPRPVGRLVLAVGRIPRRKANAPSVTMPCNVSTDELRSLCERIRSRIELLQPEAGVISRCGNRTPHPILGPFTPSEWLRFISIHQRHHLGIISEILAANVTAPVSAGQK